MRLRPLDDAGLRAYLREIPPRFLTLRVRAGRFRFGWLVPSWAFEEPLRFVLRLAPLTLGVAPLSLRRFLGRLGVDAVVASGPGHAEKPRWWRTADALFSERGRDLLALPDGVPLLDVAAGDARIVISEIAITEIVTGRFAIAEARP